MQHLSDLNIPCLEFARADQSGSYGVCRPMLGLGSSCHFGCRKPLWRVFPCSTIDSIVVICADGASFQNPLQIQRSTAYAANERRT